MKRLLHVAHQPSENTRALVRAFAEGAKEPSIDGVELITLTPWQAQPTDVLVADAIVLGTTENLGYMSGALKDFFDRCYYPVLEQKQGLPCALWIRAGHDGTGTRRGIEAIVTGLRWHWVQPVLLMRGDWQPEFLAQVRDMGMAMAAGLEAGVF